MGILTRTQSRAQGGPFVAEFAEQADPRNLGRHIESYCFGESAQQSKTFLEEAMKKLRGISTGVEWMKLAAEQQYKAIGSTKPLFVGEQIHETTQTDAKIL
ncbi:Hypothetical predicted protein [Lecanosticta acicola]|uniref:Uncharacterized protein n=1 Tax=Lecanosticta acicola TaxID=111012 RepID=A0AAI8Z3X8_9PEZI|nr:Hypothetical predicted protein [Lecanosticta acicola]